MKVTFPHMGNAHIAIKALLEALKLDVIPPPPITNRTLELGVKYSPEFACLPLKINIGNFIESIENGANTIVMAGGWGPCRFGYYSQVQRDILSDIGYDFQMVILEAPDFRLSELIKQVKALGKEVTLWEALKALNLAWYKLSSVEELENGFQYYLPRAQDKNLVEKLYYKGLLDIDKALSKKEINEVKNKTIQELSKIPQNGLELLKIGLVGEIYTVLEPYANYSIAKQLGWLNADVSCSISLTKWVNEHLLGGLVRKSNHQHIVDCAQPYLNYWVGGHGLETVGATVDFARQNFDGIIQIGPLTCMPEIVAQTILKRVSDEENIPCMTLYFDEHSGNAGIYTRLEAFIEMLQRKKLVS
jgi:predicted nucleotide-binding protein (sugar kinase/HSP70/actin superfamily)